MQTTRFFVLSLTAILGTACSSPSPENTGSPAAAGAVTSDPGATAGTATADSGAPAASIPGPLHFGGSLPLPPKPEYTGRSAGNHFTSYKVDIGPNQGTFGADWAISVVASAGDGVVTTTLFDFESGAVSLTSAPSWISTAAAAIHAAPAPGDNEAQNAFRGALESCIYVLDDMVTGRPANQPYAEEPIPELKPYLDYIQTVDSQVGGPAFPSDKRTLPVSLINGGHLPILATTTWTYAYPASSHVQGSFELTIQSTDVQLTETDGAGARTITTFDLHTGEYYSGVFQPPSAPPGHDTGSNDNVNDTSNQAFTHSILGLLEQRIGMIANGANGVAAQAPELKPYLDYFDALMVKYPVPSGH